MTTKERKEIVKELHAAAERIETLQTRYCCSAIGGVSRYKVRMLFSDMFENDARRFPKHNNEAWFEAHDEAYNHEEVRARRVFGLLWCAELVRDGFFG